MVGLETRKLRFTEQVGGKECGYSVDDGDGCFIYMGGQAKKELPWVTRRILYIF